MMASTTGLAAPSLDGAVAPPPTASRSDRVRIDRHDASASNAFPAMDCNESTPCARTQKSNGLRTTTHSKVMSGQKPVWEAPVVPAQATSLVAKAAQGKEEGMCVRLNESKSDLLEPSGSQDPSSNVLCTGGIACGRGLMPNEGKAPSPSPAQMDKESLRVPLHVSKNGFNRPSGCR